MRWRGDCDALFDVAVQQNDANIPPNRRISIMLFAAIITHLKDRLAKRAEFRRLVAEINTLSERDLSDLRADRAEMIYHARHQVYGGQVA
jgi:hypothetical protein